MADDDSLRELDTFRKLLQFSDEISGASAAPLLVTEHLQAANLLVEQVAGVIGKGTHGPYFEVSKNRYAHYFAAGMATLAPDSLILDVGNAPGHVAIGFSLMGHRVRGLNMNAEWRSTYPDKRWFKEFDVVEHDLEHARMPFADDMFDAVLFTEVLEHIAVVDPKSIVEDIRRVLKPGGVLIFSTPNVCNISNIYALLKGKNIFWAPEIFYGSFDRHNREYTPAEVTKVMNAAGLDVVASWGLNDYSNWRTGGAEFAIQFIAAFGDDHPLCRNTITGIYRNS